MKNFINFCFLVDIYFFICKNIANLYYRIFSRFNALFVRQHIRGAIREYQTQLIQRVKDDIESLHEKFKVSIVNLL